MYNKRGEISIFRLGLIGGVVGIVLIAVGIASLLADQASRQAPLDIQIYPGAEIWGGPQNEGRGTRTLFFRASEVDPQEVATFYQQRMNEHYGDNQERCVRIPPTGDMPNTQNVQNPLPYQFVCMFDRSGLNSTQYTRVVIHPGLPDPDPFLDATGMTIIRYEQVWQP